MTLTQNWKVNLTLENMNKSVFFKSTLTCSILCLVLLIVFFFNHLFNKSVFIYLFITLCMYHWQWHNPPLRYVKSRHFCYYFFSSNKKYCIFKLVSLSFTLKRSLLTLVFFCIQHTVSDFSYGTCFRLLQLANDLPEWHTETTLLLRNHV